MSASSVQPLDFLAQRRRIGSTATMRALLAVAAGLVFATAASAVLPQQEGRVDLVPQANLAIHGAGASQGAGDSVAGAGDVNGDGLEDVVVGAPGARNNGRASSGSAYVVFGRAAPGAIDLAALGAGGFHVDGAGAGDRAGYAVAGAGDVNGDGRADVLVGAHAADPGGRSNAGSAYVVFGKGSSAPVDLAALGAQGFRIDGAAPTERAGWAVAAAGDVNGDGRADLLVGAPFADRGGRQSSGSAYVVFGKSSTETVDLALTGDWGFRIDGASAEDFTAEAIGGAGDLTGDGLGDVLVGATFADPGGRSSAGSAYVVYGKRTNEPVDLAALGAQGFRIDGAAAGDGAGAAVAAGDVDGDGRTDLLVGAVFADANARRGSGSVHVLFGPRAGVDLAAVGDEAARIDGAAVLDFAGGSVAPAGDANGDGRGDVLVGAAGVDSPRGEDSGAAYVVYAIGSSAVVDLAALGGQGFRMDGARGGDAAGGSVAGAGDVNGDGRPDALVGAAGADASGRAGSGSAYVVYGFGSPELRYEPLVATAGRRVTSHRPALVRRTGAPRFSVSRALPLGLRLDPRSGAVSGTPVTFTPQSVYTVSMRDLAGSVSAPLVIRVRDTRAPRLTLGGPAMQRVLRQGGVIVTAACDEPCRMTASGRIVVPGRGATIGLQTARTSLNAPGRATLRLALSRNARRRLSRLLEQGERARAIVFVRAVDAGGNARLARRVVAVRS
jgi:hypothetical protein